MSPSFVSRVREGIVLTAARRTVTERSTSAQENVQRKWMAARARLRVAERLDPRTEFLAARPLYREGIVALVAAAAAAVGSAGSAAQDDRPLHADIDVAWRELEGIWDKLDTGVPFSTFRDVPDRLRDAPLLDRAPTTELSAFASVDRLALLLERRIEPRSLTSLQRSRLARIGLVVAIPLVLLAWSVPRLFRQRSLAEHKPVTLSSRYPDSMAPFGGEDLVNGFVERTYGAHTSSEENPWMMIDLEQATPVRRIVVYNRGDGWFTDQIPLVAEVGIDASALHVIGRRDTVFTQRNPWEITLDESVRFIKLTKKGKSTMALAEVSVYSR